MPDQCKAIVRTHWEAANARDWETFKTLLADHLEYEVPQTREYIDSGTGYLEMFRTWPGAWVATVKHLVCEDDKAFCLIDFVVGDERMTGISLFEVEDGKIVRVTDYWPDPYEPPPRATPHLKRRNA